MKYVFITANNVREVYSPDERARLKYHPNYLEFPDCSAVQGVPPHFWKRVPGTNRFVEMSRPEKLLREAHIRANGADNALPLKPLSRTRRAYRAVKVVSPLWWALTGAFILKGIQWLM